MDAIKDAFTKVKQDMDTLKYEIQQLNYELSSLKNEISYLRLAQETQFHDPQPSDQQRLTEPTDIPTQSPTDPTNQQTIPTDKLNEPLNMPQYSLKGPISSFSTGNEGVPTDRQTNQQTDRHINTNPNTDKISRLERAAEILNSLDELKREVRIKFKKLTEQEMTVFSTIYTLEELGQQPDYPLVAEQLKLSESSIRDYVRKIMNKGIPVDKIKEDNKKVVLSISSDLKRIASLQTIMQLREL